MTCVCVVDIGSTFVKCCVFDDLTDEVLATTREASAQGGDGRAQVAAAHAGLARVLQAAAGALLPPARITHVALTSAAMTWVGTNARGEVATPLFSYATTGVGAGSTLPPLSGEAAAYHDRVGAPWGHPAYAPTHVHAHRGDSDAIVSWSSLSVLLTEALVGAAAGQVGISSSEAAWAGLLDGRNVGSQGWGWDDETVTALGLAGKLPPLRGGAWQLRLAADCACPLRTLLGRTWDAESGCTLALAVGDGAAAAVGSGCWPLAGDRGEAQLALTVGTSAALRCVVTGAEAEARLCRGCGAAPAAPSPRCEGCGKLRLSGLGLWAYPFTDCSLDGAGRGHVLVGGALTDGGSVVGHLSRAFGPCEEGWAEVPLLPSSITCLPSWNGERATGWDADARCTLVGLDGRTTRAEVERAGVEGVGFSLRRVHEALRLVLGAGGARARITCSGGALSSPAWCAILAHALGQPLHVLTSAEGGGPDATMLGALALARLQWARHEACPPEEAARLLARVVEATVRARDGCVVYEPSPDAGVRAAWEAAAARHALLYAALAGAHTALRGR
jgi:sugar (pentulose or hexulose) kinase